MTLLAPRGLTQRRSRHAEWCALYVSGWTLAELAARFDVTVGAVRYALKQARVPLRRVGAPRLVAETWGVVLNPTDSRIQPMRSRA